MAQAGVQSQLQVQWGHCQGVTWWSLNSVDLSHETFSEGGVYLIWHGGDKSKVVYLGQASVLRDRLTAHRTDTRIQAFVGHGLFVTWAHLAEAKRDGVERYLSDYWKPLVGERRPDVPPIPVNSPWE